MYHKLQDITLYYWFDEENAKKFTGRQNLISDLYVQFLEGYKPPKISRISVQLRQKDNVGEYFGSILPASAKFDENEYWALSDLDQNLIILNTVHRIAMLCADQYVWDKMVFERAYNKVREANFIYAFESKRKFNRNRQYRASILLEKNEEHSTISVLFYDKSDKEIRKTELLKSFQTESFYGQIIKKSKWFSNDLFGLYTANGELSIQASLETGKVVTQIEPKNHSKQELEGILRRITYRNINNQEDLIQWMNT